MKRKIHREDIMDAGEKIMFLYGYNATGIKDITDEVEIPKGSFYNHFENKESFGIEMLQRYCERGLAMYQSVLIAAEGTALERIERFFTQITNTYAKELGCKMGCLMGNFSIEMADVNESFRQLLEVQFQACEEVFVQCLQEGKEKGELSAEIDPVNLGSILLNGWHGSLLRMKSTGTVKPLEDFKRFILEYIKP